MRVTGSPPGRREAGPDAAGDEGAAQHAFARFAGQEWRPTASPDPGSTPVYEQPWLGSADASAEYDAAPGGHRQFDCSLGDRILDLVNDE